MGGGQWLWVELVVDLAESGGGDGMNVLSWKRALLYRQQRFSHAREAMNGELCAVT